MIKKYKYKPKVWWGFEALQAECNCDLDNKEVRTKQIFKSEKERNRALNKLLSDSDYCVKQYTNFCTTINEQQ